MMISGFCPIWSFPVDYMHAVCLGVAKKLTNLWFEKKFSAQPFSLYSKLEEVDLLLRNTKPPRGVKRLPRSLKERQHWKGMIQHPFSPSVLSPLSSFSFVIKLRNIGTGSCTFAPSFSNHSCLQFTFNIYYSSLVPFITCSPRKSLPPLSTPLRTI